MSSDLRGGRKLPRGENSDPSFPDIVSCCADVGNVSRRQKSAFIPFSYGPRACVGRNVAEMELALIVSTVFRNYEFELHQRHLDTREGFLRKPLGLEVGMRRRKA